MENNISKLAVMFVDDDPQMLKSLKRVVNKEPYQAFFAEGGIQALEALRQTQIQVIVSDLQMPQMSGLTLLKKVQQDYPEIIRIILTGMTDIETILEAIHQGKISRYILKPCDERELRHTIRQALDTWQIYMERRNFQAQLAEQNRLLERRVRERTAQLLAIERQAELGRYAAQIVHNLKGPLQVVVGHISLAKLSLSENGQDLESIRKHLDRINAAADNLTAIISGILQHAQNAAQFDQKWIQLNQVIENELQFFTANKAFNNNVHKEIQLDGSLPFILANPLHLQQIVDNLINNALDAMEDYPLKTLTIVTRATENYAFMEVSDTGTGIDPKNLPFIFEPDFTTKPPDKGTGLGLASVKAMVEGYGGFITVQSNEPQGAKFVVSFPLKTSEKKSEAKSNTIGQYN